MVRPSSLGRRKEFHRGDVEHAGERDKLVNVDPALCLLKPRQPKREDRSPGFFQGGRQLLVRQAASTAEAPDGLNEVPAYRADLRHLRLAGAVLHDQEPIATSEAAG
jgi:hypothetical protein